MALSLLGMHWILPAKNGKIGQQKAMSKMLAKQVNFGQNKIEGAAAIQHIKHSNYFNRMIKQFIIKSEIL